MRTIDEVIWNQTFTLPVRFDVYEGEDILPIQEEALRAILSAWDVVDDSRKDVDAYCLHENPDSKSFIETNAITEYVLPKSLFIKRDNNHRLVALLCDYRFDPEDGIAVVFENESFKEIGPQYCIL